MTEKADWMMTTKPGDKLYPHPDWNRTENNPRRLSSPTEVLKVKHDTHTQTTISFCVASHDGSLLWLDASWFTLEPELASA